MLSLVHLRPIITSLLCDELRLGYCLAIIIVVMIGSWRVSRRFGGQADDPLHTAADAILGSLAIIYVSVGLPGILGLLYPAVIAFTALGSGAALWRFGNATPVMPTPGPTPTLRVSFPDRWVPTTCLTLLLAYLVVLVIQQAYLPVLSIDALIYHLAAPVQWLQRHRIGLFPVWYQPPNAYSPLAGSTYSAFLLGIMGNDVLARFVQMPAIVLLFLATYRSAIALGVGRASAALVACGVVLSRPFISHASLAKDDLFACAFFMATVYALSPMALRQRLGPWRVGIALGLFLAVKFTVLLSLPMLLLAIDAPWRANWRRSQWAIAAGLVAMLAGPWYLRNWIACGNPLFPVRLSIGGITVFPGLFEMQRTAELATWEGVIRTIVHGYHSPPPWLALLWIFFWLSALVLRARRWFAVPLLRLCLAGPLLGLALFLWRTMYAEVRFIYPSVLLVAMGSAITLAALPIPAAVQIAIAALLAVAGIASGFEPSVLLVLLPLVALWAIGGLAVVLLIRYLQRRSRQLQWMAAGLAAAGLAMLIYVHWEAYMATYQHNITPSWEVRPAGYGSIAQAWEFVRTSIPPTEPVAVANTNMVYPLQGFDLLRPVSYVPTRVDMPDSALLPPLCEHLKGEDSITAVAQALYCNPDADIWLKRLESAGVSYLLVAKGEDGLVPVPIESSLISASPAHFRPVFDNSSATVYQIIQ